MGYRIRIITHVYAEGRFCDNLLKLHSRNYGILGKEIISPLRKINGAEQYVKHFSDTFTVRNLWDQIDAKLFGNIQNDDKENSKQIEKYLVFDNLRYSVEKLEKPLLFYLHLMDVSEEDLINIQLLASANAGEVFSVNSIHYCIKSREAGKHNIPHVHVDARHEVQGVFSIESGEKLAGGKFKGKDLREIKETILSNREFLFKYWNEHTDGLDVDLDQALGLRQ